MELEEYLRAIAEDAREGKEARRLALELLSDWSSGFVPSRKKLKRLREVTHRPDVCDRLEEDGTCPWLRKHAALENLHAPGPGDKVYCHRRGDAIKPASYDVCTGYKKRGD